MRSRKTSGKKESRAVANLVSQMQGVRSLVPPGTAPVQRAVYVDGARLNKTQRDSLGGSRQGQIKGWDKEPSKKIGFKDEAEMQNYSNEKTDDIGYLKKEKAWIRLHDKDLQVLGEDHTATTLTDIITATGNQKFIYEGYNEMPDDASSKFKAAYAKSNKEKEEAMGLKHTKESKKYNHDLELFFPKMAFLLYIITSQSQKGEYRHELLRAVVTLIDLLSGVGRFSKLGKFYAKHNTWLKQLRTDIKALEAKRKAFVGERNKKAEGEDEDQQQDTTLGDKKKEFMEDGDKIFAVIYAHDNEFDALHDIINHKALKDADEERQELDEDSRKQFKFETDKYSHSRDNANSAREVGMITRVLKASDKGYLLCGMGDNHRVRLSDILKANGIPSFEMGEYVEEATKRGAPVIKEEAGSEEDKKPKPVKGKRDKKKERAHDSALPLDEESKKSKDEVPVTGYGKFTDEGTEEGDVVDAVTGKLIKSASGRKKKKAEEKKED